MKKSPSMLTVPSENSLLFKLSRDELAMIIIHSKMLLYPPVICGATGVAPCELSVDELIAVFRDVMTECEVIVTLCAQCRHACVTSDVLSIPPRHRAWCDICKKWFCITCVHAHECM